MPVGADRCRATPFALVPIFAVAVGVVLLALLVKGGQTGTIVVERIVLSSTTTQNGTVQRPRYLITSAFETAADGTPERSFTSTTITRLGYQELDAGDTIELYDPTDDTIYVTTEQAEQRASAAYIQSRVPKGTKFSVGVMRVSASSARQVAFAPGRESVFEQQLRVGAFKVAGRRTIDGHAALELMQAAAARAAGQPAGVESRTTAYVTPVTYQPIEEIIRDRFPGGRAVVVTRWQSYRVLPATPGNRWLVSLTARHPHARLVRGAMAYLRASQSQTRTTTIRGG